MSQNGVTPEQRGAELRRRRIAAGVLPSEVASHAGVQYLTVARCERGRVRNGVRVWPSFATMQKVTTALEELIAESSGGWLGMHKTAEAIGLSTVTPPKAILRSLRERYGRTGFADGEIVTARLCGCDMRVKFGGLTTGKFRCNADDVQEAAKNHAKLTRQLEDGQLIEGRWKYRREVYLSSAQAYDDEEIAIGPSVLHYALDKAIGFAPEAKARERRNGKRIAVRRNADELIYAIAARGVVRIEVYGMMVRVRLIPRPGLGSANSIAIPGFSRKDLVNVRKSYDDEPTHWTLEKLAQRLGVSIGTISEWRAAGAPIDLVKPDFAKIKRWREDRDKAQSENPILGAEGSIILNRERVVSIKSLAKKYHEHIRTEKGELSKAPFQLLRHRAKKAGVTFTKKVQLARRMRGGQRNSIRDVEFARDADVRKLLGIEVKPPETKRPEPDAAVEAEQVAPAQPQPYVPSGPERRILAALDGRALSTNSIASKARVERRMLFDFRRRGNLVHGYLTRLKDAGLVRHHERRGFYRPDAPPPELC